MLWRRSLITLLLASCVAVPILIGASCPPPTSPIILGLTSDSTNTQNSVVPACIPNFVCVNISNGTTAPVDTALYVYDGYDSLPTPKYQASTNYCCNVTINANCVCACRGGDVGNCKLTLPQLIDPAKGNLKQHVQFAAGQSTLLRYRCTQIKDVGLAVAPVDPTNAVDAITGPVDIAGPIYRDEFGGVPCGQTVQFLVTDLNQSGSATGVPSGTATLIIKTAFSQ